MVRPFLFIVASHISIARDPSGKKCGPRLFPMMFEKIKLVLAAGLNPCVTIACLIDRSPSIVIGQLFMALALTVTMKLRAKTEKTDGRDSALTKRVAKKSIAPACLNP